MDWKLEETQLEVSGSGEGGPECDVDSSVGALDSEAGGRAVAAFRALLVKIGIVGLVDLFALKRMAPGPNGQRTCLT